MAKTPEQLVLESLKVLLYKSLYDSVEYEAEVRNLIGEIDKHLPKKKDYYGDW